MSHPLSEKIAENLTRVRQRVAAAADRAGRDVDEIRVVAVTKYVDTDLMLPLIDAGCCDLGESRPQALWEKVAKLATVSPKVRWHMIGHLQRNKVARTLPIVHLVHALDSERLVAAVHECAAKNDQVVAGLLEVNLSGDESKHGWSAEQLRATASEIIDSHPQLRITGLMGMSGLGATLDQARLQFRSLRELRDSIQDQFGLALPELSMGMSGDYEIAIEEGATLVRIGSALFEGCL